MTRESQTTPTPDAPRRWDDVATYLIVASCSILFCSKGVFIKGAYGLGADPIAVLGLRMAYALPFFLLAAVWSSRGGARLSLRHWLAMAGLGFVGYYLSAVVNFAGLQFISVGMERVVLYTYPSLVLIGSAVFLGRRVPLRMAGAMMVAYLGVVVAFQGEASGAGDPRGTLIGVGLVFTSAVTYAIFVLGSGKMIAEVGPTRFTSHVVGISCVFVLAHFAIQRMLAGPVAISPGVHAQAMVLAVFGTVIPSFLLGVGLKRAGAQRFAIIGTVGPLATIVLAWLVLGEALNGVQITGFLLTMGGGLLVTLWK